MIQKLKNPEFVQRVQWLIDTRFDGIPARLSESSGVSRAGLSKILNEGTRPFARTVTKLVNGAGCSRDWLVDGIGEAFPGPADTTLCETRASYGPLPAPDAGLPERQRFIRIYSHVSALTRALPVETTPERLAKTIAIAAHAATPAEVGLDVAALESTIVAVEKALVQHGIALDAEQRAIITLNLRQLDLLTGGRFFDHILAALLDGHPRQAADAGIEPASCTATASADARTPSP